MTHTRNDMVAFKPGVSANDLIEFYNHPEFKDGKPLYDSSNVLIARDQMRDAGVMILEVPEQVKDHLASQEWQGTLPEEMPIATDAMITLAGIDGLAAELTEEEFRMAAVRKTIGDKPLDSHEALVQGYLRTFPHLLMTAKQQNSKDTLSSYRPKKELLDQYQVLGVVPAPLHTTEGVLERRVLSLNIRHQFDIAFVGSSNIQADPQEVEKLYATFLR